MKISKGTIIRTLMLGIVLSNLVLRKTGHTEISFGESEIAVYLEMLLEVATVIICWWKNNSFSDNARKADEFLQELKESEE